MVSNQVTTDRSGGRKVRGQITQNGDRLTVAKWPPADQFPDSRLCVLQVTFGDPREGSEGDSVENAVA